MESIVKTNEVIQANTFLCSTLPSISSIKEEICDEDMTCKIDDFDFEPFHENVFRTLSSNFDSVSNISEVDGAFKHLESCFIENNILNQYGESKFLEKDDTSTYVFLKYRDIDDAFSEMIISDNHSSKLNNNSGNCAKKIDLKNFSDNIFSMKIDDDSYLSGSNAESLSRIGETDSDDIEELSLHIDESLSGNDDDFYSNNVGSIENEDSLGDTLIDISQNDSESKIDIPSTTPKLDTVPVEDDSPVSLKDTVRDVRVLVKKLENTSVENSVTNSKDVDFKKNDEMVLNSFPQQDTPDNQESSKDENVPNVFDKMTRAGKRDLERVLAESTANLVIQKTSQLISEKIKELQNNTKDYEGSSSDDEAKESDIHKTAEIVTNTIIEFLTKSKSKKLGKEISDEITNKMNNLNTEGEVTSRTEEILISNLRALTPKKLDSSTEIQSMKSPENSLEILTMKSIEKTSGDELKNQENILESVTEKTTEKKMDEKISKGAEKTSEECAKNVRDTRAQRKKNASNNFTNCNVRKTLAEEFEEITRANCELNDVTSSEIEEPKKPEIRQLRQRPKEVIKSVSEPSTKNVEAKKRSTKIKRKGGGSWKSRKIRMRRNYNKLLKSKLDSAGADKSIDDQLIDGQFLIDAELTEDVNLQPSPLIENNSIRNSKDVSGFVEPIILKATADSTTSENEESCYVSSRHGNLQSSETDNEVFSNSCNELGTSIRSEETCSEACDIDMNSGTADSISFGEPNGLPGNVTNPSESYTVQNVKELKNVDDACSGMISHIVQSRYDEMECGKEAISAEKSILNIPPDSLSDQQNVTANGQLKEKIGLGLKTNEVEQSIEAPFKLLNDMITDIEKKLEEYDVKNEAMISKKPKEYLELEPDDIRRPEKDISKENFEQSMEIPVDTASFLNYTLEDSFRLTIDEGSPNKADCAELEGEESMGKIYEENSLKDNNSTDYNDAIKITPETKVLSPTKVLEKKVDGHSKIIETKKTPEENILAGVVKIKQGTLANITQSTSCTNAIEDTYSDSITKVSTGILKPDVVSANIQTETAIDNKNSNFGTKKPDADRKPLTNEEKIAQLTKRDPRLMHEKKISSVLMRDPRMRNKLSKNEEKPAEKKTTEQKQISEQKSNKTNQILSEKKKTEEKVLGPKSCHKNTSNHKSSDLKVPEHIPIDQKLRNQVKSLKEQKPPKLDRPPSPDPESLALLKPVSVVEPQINDNKSSSSKSESTETNIDLNYRKKQKKAVDEELLYKTPLSDLHEMQTDRPTYERTIKKRIASLENKDRGDREIVEEFKVSIQRRIRISEEANEERRMHIRPLERQQQQDYFRCDTYNERNVSIPNEGMNRTDSYYEGAALEERSLHSERFEDFRQEAREHYELETFARRQHNEITYDSNHGRNDFQENIYSRRDFFRRNKYAHDHDHFSSSSSSRTLDSSMKNYHSQHNNFDTSSDLDFRMSAYPPVSLLPDPVFRQEDYEQAYGNLDTDSFSPPSSDLCPPPPLIRSPTPEIRRNFCPSPPRIRNSPDSRDYEEFRSFCRNYDERNFSSSSSRSNMDRDNDEESNRCRGYRRGQGRDYHHNWRDESPPRKRFAMEHSVRGQGHDDRGSGSSRWRRSPSWSPDRSRRRWSRERSLSPPLREPPRSWDLPRSPSPPPRRHDNYRERSASYKQHYHRY